MMWICDNDGVAFAAGLSFCPQCGSVEAHEEGSDVHGKISRLGGTTRIVPNEEGQPELLENRDPDSHAEPGLAEVQPTGGVFGEPDPDAEGLERGEDAERADGVESEGSRVPPHDVRDHEDRSADQVDDETDDESGSEPAEDRSSWTTGNYDSWNKEQLRGECTTRGLDTGGSNRELSERLRESDSGQNPFDGH